MLMQKRNNPFSVKGELVLGWFCFSALFVELGKSETLSIQQMTADCFLVRLIG